MSSHKIDSSGNREEAKRNKRLKFSIPCIHEGAILEYCNTCNGAMKHVRECDKYSKATYAVVSDKVHSCKTCNDYEPDTTLVTEKVITQSPVSPALERRTMQREELKQRLLRKAQERQAAQQQQSQPLAGITPNSLRARRLILKSHKDRPVPEKNKGTQPQQIQSSNTGNTDKPYEPKPILAISKIKPDVMTWAVGVTTVPIRRHTTLPITLQSLILSGFPEPRLFIDIQGDAQLADIIKLYNDPSFPLTIRSPNIRTFGNWFLALMEIYIRNPHSHRYALFQDDITMCLGVREYLEHCEYPERGYINLLTYPQNESQKLRYFPKGLPEEKMIGWYPSNQMGKGAQALVFNREILLKILSSHELINRPQEEKGHQNVDGGLSIAMRKMGCVEYVHTPSLVRHIGAETTMGPGHPKSQPQDISFRGDNWDVMEIVRDLL